MTSKSIKKAARNPEQLLNLIHAQFPELTYNEYRLVSEGWDHEVLILDNALVFRFPNDDEYAGLLKNEIRLLDEIKDLVPIRVPGYTYVSTDGTFAGYPIIPGQQLSKFLFDSLGKEDRSNIARQLAAFLSFLHGYISSGHDVSYIPGWDFAEEQSETRSLAAKYLPSVLSDDDYHLVEQILNEVDGLVTRPLPKVFTHSDLYSSHLFWDADNKTIGVIDFSDMSQSDPAFDFGELYEYGPAFVNEVYEQYMGLKDESFLDRAWIYQKWAGVHMMTDHFVVHKTDFTVARETFDRVKTSGIL